MADMLVDVIEHMHQILFDRWDEETVIDVMGPHGVRVWVAFKPTMLKTGSYTVSIDPDSSVPQTKAQRENKALQLYQILSQDPMIDPLKLRRYLLHELHGTAFDDMIMLPGGIGTQQNPMSVNDYLGMMQQAGGA